MNKKSNSKNEIPIVRAVKILSWLSAAGGIVLGAGMIILLPAPGGKVAGGFIIIMFVILAVVLRLLGSIGQILFETQKCLYDCLHDIQALGEQIGVLNASVRSGNDAINLKIEQGTDKLSKGTEVIAQHCVQVSCDTKDLNKSSHEIKHFFNQIAKRLDINE